MAWTELRQVTNDQDGNVGVLIVNMENKGDDMVSFSQNFNHTVRVSQHENIPLCISTKKGVYQLWDKDWKVWAKLNNGTPYIILQEGAGGTIRLIVESDGKLICAKY